MDKNKSLRKIANTLYITTQKVQSTGLLSGKTGIALFLYNYAKISNNPLYSDFADALLDKICDGLSKNIPPFFAEGISGIGWGLNYLMKEKYVEAEDNDVLDEIDDAMRKMDGSKFFDDLNEKIPLFTKGLYFAARELKEDMLSTFNELDNFLQLDSLNELPNDYLYSVNYFLTKTDKMNIEPEKSRYLISKLPVYETIHPYWENLLYGIKKQNLTEKEMKIISEQIDKIINDIHYYALGLDNGLAGLGMSLL